ncbi:hypothetical protein GGI07_004797 [Coemansia sp. Benny D115]|nr:hypothetical protein GGI07_004797 [Coemansia sp. Benny D115]
MHHTRHGFCPSKEGWGPWSASRELDLTPCFEHGVLLPALSALFLAVAVYRIGILRQMYALPRTYTRTAAFWTKISLSTAVFIAAVVNLLLVAKRTHVATKGLNVFAVSQLIQAATYAAAAALHYYEHTRARNASDTLLLFWLASIVLALVSLRTDYQTGWLRAPHSHPIQWALSAVPLGCMGLLFVVELWPRKLVEYVLPEDDDTDSLSASRFGVHSPEEDANIFSRLSFAWLTPLLQLGRHKQITEADLWCLPAHLAPLNVTEKFGDNWQHELDTSTPAKQPSLLRALWKTLGLPFALAGVLKLLQDILQFSQPVLLARLIGFVASHTTEHPQPISHGFFYATAMLVLQVVQTLFLHQYFQLCMVTGMKAKSSLTATIYRKALSLSNDTRQKYTTGSITTMFSVDVERVGGVTDYTHIVWSGPLQVLLAIYLLYQTLGWSVFAGIVIMVVSIPINTWITKRMRDLQLAQMKNKDARNTLIDEALSGIKVIKLYAWERSFLNRIRRVRESRELVTLSKYGHMYAWSSVTSMAVPFMVSFATFWIYSVFDGVSHGPLSAQLIFVSLSLFNLLRFPLTMFPIIVSSLVDTSVALNRIYSLLTSDELDPDSITRLASTRKAVANSDSLARNDTAAVHVADAAFRWSERGPIVLDNIDFAAHSAEHLAIIGRVGAGKSSLVSALLGDMRRERGNVTIRGQVAYAPQQPWIMNATLRDNILFGLKYDEAFYNRVIDACALRADLDVLAAGDMTEIGEKGINLSGGQKARVSLARAVYSRADVYILDDPLSAVDAHVGRHLFEHILGPRGMLRSRCRIHVTNAIQFINKCDSAMLLRDGLCVEQGSMSELIARRGLVYGLIQEFGTTDSSTSMTPTPTSTGAATPTSSSLHQGDNANDDDADDADLPVATHARRLTATSLPPASIAPIQRTGQLHTIGDSGDSQQQPRNTLITEEISAVGKVSTMAYIDYFRSCSWSGTTLFAVGMILNQGLLVLSNVWLKTWSAANEEHSRSEEEHGSKHGPMYYIAIYGLFGIAATIFCYIRSVVQWSVCVVRSGRSTHQKMLEAVFRSPMSFFDTTPLGRILQRFAKDQNSVDESIPRTASSWFQNLTNITLSLVVIVVSLPMFGLVMLPVLVFFFHLKNYFLLTSRTLKRLDSTSRSPIYSSFQESLVGASTIRAYGKSDRFIAENLRKIDANQRCVYPYLSLNRWLAVRIEFMSAFIIFATALLGVISLIYGNVDAGLVGLSVTYALQSTQQINWMLRMECDLENSMCDYVRIQEFQQLKPEAPEIVTDNRPAKQWPEQGMVEFKGYSTRYREGLDLVLKDLSFRVLPRQKIGIVGRTGAGKSSLTLALFRIIEAAGGQILIDGEDISQYGLYDVRSKLSIIPQDPVLFAGSVRENLDPFASYSDEQIWLALEHAHLADVIRDRAEGLDFVVTQGGENFSVGQRQLICLARALLKRAKVLVLDEATAAIDNSTDAIIQASIRKEFKDCTVLTIAHRLNTIIDSDMILVIDGGRLAEYDTPEHLLANENSLFAKLVEEARNSDAH